MCVPLNTIVMGTECLSSLIIPNVDTAAAVGISPMNKTSGFDAQIHEILNDFRFSTNSIEDMIRNCNMYQSLREKQFVLQKNPFSLRDMFNCADKMVRLQLKDLIINFKIAVNLPEIVEGDSILLTRFLVYVILNCARRSGVTNSVHVDVQKTKTTKSIFRSPVAGEFPITINVTDTGDCIEKEEEVDMFSAFSTLETCNDIDKV